jgi:hypothetical protein
MHKTTFNVQKIIPIPVPMNQKSFLYIDVGESILCMDLNYHKTVSQQDDLKYASKKLSEFRGSEGAGMEEKPCDVS